MFKKKLVFAGILAAAGIVAVTGNTVNAEQYDESTGTAVVAVNESAPETGALTLLAVPSFAKELATGASSDSITLDTVDSLEIQDTRIVKGDWILKANATQLLDDVTSLGVTAFAVTTTKSTLQGFTESNLTVATGAGIFQTNGTLYSGTVAADADNYDLAIAATDVAGTLTRVSDEISDGTYTDTITYTLVDGI
ncbi:MAG: hypothetical protein LKF42_06790 [Streptococcaceae bacterium]|jgi:hypothetical protein|nr:hypothetical protein [Streptococcaceae bacterium]MCH4177787.1 hypothetical protein [Streptococcaceae bacterium]